MVTCHLSVVTRWPFSAGLLVFPVLTGISKHCLMQAVEGRRISPEREPQPASGESQGNTASYYGVLPTQCDHLNLFCCEIIDESCFE